MSQRAGSFDEGEELEGAGSELEASQELELSQVDTGAEELLEPDRDDPASMRPAENGGQLDTPVEPPRPGTLAWLLEQPHVDVQGTMLPQCHRVPADAELGEPELARCRVIKSSGERCRATPTRAYGLCSAHLGGGAQDLAAASKLGHARRAVLKQRRELLGIGAARVGSARQHARLRALDRAEELAAALVDGPLDDAELGSMARQTAALRALDAVEPLATISLEATLPREPDAVAGLGWAELEQLASRLLPARELEQG